MGGAAPAHRGRRGPSVRTHSPQPELRTPQQKPSLPSGPRLSRSAPHAPSASQPSAQAPALGATPQPQPAPRTKPRTKLCAATQRFPFPPSPPHRHTRPRCATWSWAWPSRPRGPETWWRTAGSTPQPRARRSASAAWTAGSAGGPALPYPWSTHLPITSSSLSNAARPLEIPPTRRASQREGSSNGARVVVHPGRLPLVRPHARQSGLQSHWLRGGARRAAGGHLKGQVR